jgi:hypothetical protein
MTVSRRQRYWSAACAALAAGAAGCGQLLSYPDVGAEQSASTCSDGKDNDLDGKIDCEDSDCKPYCLENTDAACHDGKDNDFDGKTDCESADCAPYCVENTEETCHDGKDNDQNHKTDCKDEACAAFCPEADQKACSDGIDNDSDGKIDCDDPDCDGFCPEESLLDCNDGRDNDGDGLIDGADPRCWLLAAPEVQRCAEASGVEIVENFEGPQFGLHIYSEWAPFGTFVEAGTYLSVFVAQPHAGGPVGSRRDLEAAFGFNTTQATTLDTNLGGLTRAWQFSGSWRGFELTFSASVPIGALLRVAIVPPESAPIFGTAPVADNARFALTLDGAHAPPTFTLEVDGAAVSAPLPVTRSLCAGGVSLCGDDLSQVRVILDDQGFYATLDRPNGETAEIRAPGPSSLSLPPSRLVFWGGTTEFGAAALLDDLHVSVAPDAPCGFVAPQIPGPTCDFKDDLRAFGHQVSLARGSDGQACALVSAGQDASVLNPDTLTAWTSPDGQIWAPASSPGAPPVELPAGAPLVGAGIAHDDAGFHVAVAFGDGPDVSLGFAEGQSCGAWGSLSPGPTLFPDAEAPSYVIANGQHAVYFTRPATDQLHRTLWRVVRVESDLSWLDPELLAELPANVASPVSVARVGAEDLVLIHPTALGTGLAGVGILVSDAGARSWHAVDPSPILDIEKGIDNYNGSLAFDDQGIRSAALSWDQNGGFLLYGAASNLGLNTIGVAPTPGLSVGTARIVPAGQRFPSPSSAPLARCGDGTCDPKEDCETCPADCACAGSPLLSDVFTQGAPRQLVSTDPHPAAVEYLDLEHAALNWASGGDTWSVLPLERALVGDFELSFDLVVAYSDLLRACSAYIGLGTAPDLAGLEGTGGATPEGVFARFAYSAQCIGLYWTTPLVRSGGAAFTGPGEGAFSTSACQAGDRYSAEATRRHVLLRREGNQVSVSLARDDGCGLTTQTVEYSGPLPDLPALLVGFGGPGFESCRQVQGQSVGAGTISNLRLRLLDDPSQCPDGKQLCGQGSEQPSCVDTDLSVEHCGACGHACAANEICSGGACVCSSSPGILSCDGVCVDSLTSIEHCGACGNTCAVVCTAGVCDVFAGTCSSPIPLAPEGGTFPLDFSKQKPDPVPLCGTQVNYEEVLSWTPSQSGTATLGLHTTGGAALALFGIGTDPTCSTVLSCADSSANGQPVVLPVVAGTTYYISVGTYFGDPSLSVIELSIQVQ